MNICHTSSMKHLQININIVTHQEISKSFVIFTDPCTKGSSTGFGGFFFFLLCLLGFVVQLLGFSTGT